MADFDAFSIADTVALPRPPTGWFDYGYTVLMDGGLALVRARLDYHVAFEAWRRAWQADDTNAAQPTPGDGEVRLSIFDGMAESEVTHISPGFFPMVDRLADGRWLLAHPRAWQGENNAFIYSASGTQEASLHLGDGIEELLCAPDGSIWVGYFDEGIFGSQNDDGSWPVSTGGIVQFTPSGDVRWSLRDSADAPSVDDCYAMTLNGVTPWACYYSDFPIVRIADNAPKVWTNSVTGAKALAIAGDVALLAGGYGDDEDRLAVVRLRGSRAHHLGDLGLPSANRTVARLRQGRDGVMHLVQDGAWTKIGAERAAAAIEQNRFDET